MSGQKNFTRTEPGIRVDNKDFDNAAFVSQFEALNTISSELLLGNGTSDDAISGRIIEGFAAQATTGSALSIRRGTALVGARIRGKVYKGMLISEGPLLRTLDVSSYADGSYLVYIRFEFSETSIASRAFWDDVASPQTETTRTIPTRHSNDWSLIAVPTIPAPTPGEEWVGIGTLAVSSGAISSWVPARDFLFDGRESNSFVLTDTDWGTSTERGDSKEERQQHHLRGLAKFAKAVLRQIQDIIGDQQEATNAGLGWWKPVSKSLADMLPHDGSRRVTGNILPDTTNTRQLGDFTDYFARMVADVLEAKTSITTGGDIGATSGTVTAGDMTVTQLVGTPAAQGSFGRDSFVSCRMTAVCNGTTSPTVTLSDAVNVTAVSIGPGANFEWTITFDRDLENTNYVVVAKAWNGGSNVGYIGWTSSKSVGNCVVRFLGAFSGAGVDLSAPGPTGTIVDVVVFGKYS